eukprot:2687753-Pleurochrysis_carterae.AAC.2
MAEQRKHQLDEKRKELVDARLKQVMPPACPPPATASPRNQGFQGRACASAILRVKHVSYNALHVCAR